MRVAMVVGQIASGKSFVCSYLASRACKVLDLDKLAKEMQVPGKPAYAPIATRWPDVIRVDGTIDAQKLASHVFANKVELTALESYVMPPLTEMLTQEINSARKTQATFEQRALILEVSVLPNALELLPLMDEVLYIHADKELRLERAVARGLVKDDVISRMASQPDDAYFLQFATKVIENNGGEAELKSTVDSWLAEFLEGEC